MNSKHMIAAFCAAGLAFGALAEDAKPANEEETAGLSWTPGEGVSFGETPIVSAEVGVAFDSRYLTYGVIDGKDPIITPSAQITFFDWVYFSVEAIYDVTKGNGKKGEYGARTGKRSTLDMIAGISHEFETCEAVGNLSFDFNYIYEYFRRYDGEDDFGDTTTEMDDTQYLNLELALNDLWFEPALSVERDIMADDGTYFNFSVGHEFPLVDGEGEDADPVLAFRPSVGQGFGTARRVRLYDFYLKNPDAVTGEDVPLDHGGFMDTTFKGELTWNIGGGVSLSGYIAYSDYLLDARTREGARRHNAAWGRKCDHSWNFYGGVALSVAF